MRSSVLLLFVGVPLGLVSCIAEGNFAQRYAETFCDKLDSCGVNPFENCEATAKTAAEETLDECDDYKGGLAYKCLEAVEDQSCTATNVPEACEDFDDACGIDQEYVEFAPGVEMRGLGVRLVSDPDAPPR